MSPNLFGNNGTRASLKLSASEKYSDQRNSEKAIN